MLLARALGSRDTGSVGAELIHADERTDGHTDMTKLIVSFRSCANPPTDRCEHTVYLGALSLLLFYPALPRVCV